MNNEMNNQEEQYYTRKKVAELLGISERTVYSYVKDEKIKAVPNPYRMRKEALYYRPEVDALAKELKEVNLRKAASISTVGKQLGVSRQHIEYLIKANELPTNRLEIKNTVRITLPDETIEALAQLVEESRSKSPKYRKSTYYNEQYNLTLHQKFTDDEGVTFRVAVRGNEWGYEDTREGNFIDYKTASTMLRLKPAYTTTKATIKETNYVELTLLKNEPISWDILDYFLETRGTNNLSIRDNLETIQLFIVQGIISLLDYPLPVGLPKEKLPQCVTAGDLVINENELFLAGSSRRLYTFITLDNYLALSQEAEKRKKNLGEMLDEILLERYKSERNT